MKNKFMRSVTAMVVAVTMLISSQGVVTSFADGGDHSDMSESSSVQMNEVGNNGTNQPTENGTGEDAAVKDVVEMINALPAAETITKETNLVSLKDQVNAARAAYDELSDDQKAAFNADVLGKLTALEAKISELESGNQETESSEAVQNVIEKIDAAVEQIDYTTETISATDGTTVTKTHITMLKDLDPANNAELKALIDKETAHEQDETQPALTEEEAAKLSDARKAFEDAKAKYLSEGFSNAQLAARQAYDALATEEEKAQVTNYSLLEAMEENIAYIMQAVNTLPNGETVAMVGDTDTEENIPPLEPKDLTNVWVNFNCLNNNNHDFTHWKSLDQVNQEFYSFTRVTSKNYSVTLNNLSGLIEEYDSTNTHSFVSSEPPYVTMLYTGGEWGVDDDGKNTFTIDILCAPTDEEIKTALDGKVNVICDTQPQKHAAQFYGVDFYGAYTRPEVMKENTYVVTINHNVYPAKYDSDFLTYPAPKHTLIEGNPTESLATFVWNSSENKWELQEDKDTLAEIHVQCEYPTLDQDDLANLWVNFFCINDEAHNKEHWTNLASCTAEIDYHIEYDKEGFAEVTLLNPEQFAKTYCDSTLKVPHLYVGYEPESLELYWNGEKWVPIEGPKSAGADSFTISILCGPSIARINELLNAQIICVNDDAKHQKTASFDNLLDYSFDVTNLKNDNSVVTAEVVVKPSLYLDKFYNISGGIEHSVVIDNETYPVNEDGSVTVRFSYTGGEWNLLYPTRNMVTFPVKCTTQKPIDPPTEEQVEALFDGVVTVDCINPNVVHPTRTYGITKDQFEIGDVWSMVPYANSETTSASFVDVSINVNASHFFNLYDTETGHASINRTGSVPTIIRLMFNNETNAWEKFEPAGSINLTVTCTTGGGTIDPNPNPGGGGDNDDDDDRYTGGNTVTRTINDDDVPLNDRPTNTTTIDDEDVPLADLPDDTVTIDDEEVPLKDIPNTGDMIPVPAMVAAVISLGGIALLMKKHK